MSGLEPDESSDSTVEFEMASPVRRTGTFASLQVARFRLLWVGGLFTFLSLQMLFLVRGFLAFELTGNNSSLGLMYLGFGVTMVVATPFGGVAADRLGKRQVMIVGQALMAVVSAAIAAAIIFEVIAFWMLVVGAVTQGLSFALVGPARVAFTAQLAGTNYVGNAMVLMQMALHGTRIVGPSVAGVLVGISIIGAEGVYLTSAGLMILSLLFTVILPAGAPVSAPTERPLRNLVDGLTYVRDHPRLLALLLAATVTVTVGFPYVAFIPSLVGEAYEILGEEPRARAIGWLSTTQALGAVAATLVVARRADTSRAWLEQARWGLGFGTALVLLGLAPVYGVGLVAIIATGAASSGFQALNNAVVLTMADERYHGRVQSLMMVGFGAFGIMAYPLGVLADQIGLRQTLTLMGAFVLVTLAVFLTVWNRLSEPSQALTPTA